VYDRLFDSVPEIEGLAIEPELEGEEPRLVYRAKEGNPYQLAANAYAGELRKNVYINECESPAIALLPEVAGSIYREQGGKGLIIPLEISKDGEPIYISSATRLSNGLGCLLVGFEGYMELVNTLQSTDSFVISSNSMDISLSREDETVNLKNCRVLVPLLPEGAEAAELITFYIPENFLCEQTGLAAAGFGSGFNIQVSSPLLICGFERDLGEDSLLMLKNRLGEDVPVFITALS